MLRTARLPIVAVALLIVWSTAGAAQRVNCEKEMDRLTITGTLTEIGPIRVQDDKRYFALLQLASERPCKLNRLAIVSDKAFSIACKVGTTISVTGEYESLEMVGWLLTAVPEDVQCK